MIGYLGKEGMMATVLLKGHGNRKVSHLGFLRYSKDFLDAAKGYKQPPKRFSPVPYFLYCLSIELALKAFLIKKGTQVSNLRECYGHNLKRTLKRTNDLGLSDIVAISAEQEKEISKANKHYAYKERGGFEYFHPSTIGRGNKTLPDLSSLEKTAVDLVNKLDLFFRNPLKSRTS